MDYTEYIYPFTDEKIIIKKEDYNSILDYCRQGIPEESCGLIGGKKDENINRIEKVYFLTNIDHSNEHFSMDPKEQLDAYKDARANGYDILGNFHSHPESPSRPSEEDKKLAYDSKAIYMILSLMEDNNPVLRAFHVEKNSIVTEHEIIVE
ncbi:MAG: M67 family metallopeptidase [Lachnospiraceae bacterium]|nr:M67 family metallopeptidase [Lachnospiraceae bacterium]